MGLFDRKQSGIASLDQGCVDDADLTVAVHIRERLKERGGGDPGFMALVLDFFDSVVGELALPAAA